MVGRMTLHGTVAAVVTPLRDGGTRMDLGAVEGLAAFVAAGGCDGVLVAGTTGEGLLLSTAERRALTEAWLDAVPDGIDVAVHAGAQTTAEAVALAEHAAQAGAAAVARRLLSPAGADRRCPEPSTRPKHPASC